jgi:hypothetical protein
LELLLGVGALLLRGGPRRVVVGCQLAGLVAMPLLASVYEPLLWAHPFGPLTKNVSILLGTWLVLRLPTTSG